MSKIWYCRNCGYEVASRGRCHLCRQRLVASALPELSSDEDDDEVGYRLEGWRDRDRGRLIEELNDLEILHRFEDDELVVGADDEARVDDLIDELAANPDLPEGADGLDEGAGLVAEADEATTAGMGLLADAAERLRRDPTDMHADADVAEASAVVFMADGYPGVDEETWAAVGRVTRRLLAALGADEALEDEIQTQAAILEKLLDPVLSLDLEVTADAAVGLARHGSATADIAEAADSAAAAGSADAGDADESAGDADESADSADSADHADESDDSDDSDEDETVYELPEWLPEQRAQLSVLLDTASIHYEWDGDELVVPADHEAEVEALFDRVGAPPDSEEDDDDGEARYRTLEELFAAADRLAGDPADEQRAAEALLRFQEAAGPTPFGMDDVQWFRIMTQARAMAESILTGQDAPAIGTEAAALRDLLRAVV